MKNFRAGFFLSISAWQRSWNFIFRNGLTHFFLYPVIISILLSMGAIAGIKMVVEFVMDFITPKMAYTPLPGDGWWEKTLSVLADISTYVISFFIAVISFYTFRKISKYLVLVLMSPVMAALSARTERILTGNKAGVEGGQWIRDVVRGIALAIRNFFLETFLTLAIWIGILYIGILIPPLALILSPFCAALTFFVSAYFFGFSAMDYTSERRKLSIGESIRFIRRNKGIAIGNGTMFALLFMFPFVGVTIATITNTVGATLAIHENEKRGEV